MINGSHFLLYTTDPDADQAALKRLLGSRAVPAGPDRLIFALPPAEIATHEGSGELTQRHAGRDLLGLVLYLMCDDLQATVDDLKEDGFRCTEIEESEFGVKTTLVLPGGGEIGLYQPSHETAFDRQATS